MGINTALSVLVTCVLCTNGGKIKVVDAPFAFNNPAAGNARILGETGDVPLIARVQPAKVSGPPYLIENLFGRCFENTISTYQYKFCPFQNITQREETYRWNAFHGVLGVWKEWVILNNTFDSMLMVRGDVCSPTLDRQVKVHLKCGEENKIVSVEEPSMCHYVMEFRTPFACPRDVFEVYPALTPAGQAKYRSIEESFALNDITQKGYAKRRKKLFIREGLMVVEDLSNTNKAKPTTSMKHVTNNRADHVTSNNTNDLFLSKEQCMEEYKKVLAEKDALLVKLTNLSRTDGKKMKLSLKTNKTISKINAGKSIS